MFPLSSFMLSFSKYSREHNNVNTSGLTFKISVVKNKKNLKPNRIFFYRALTGSSSRLYPSGTKHTLVFNVDFTLFHLIHTNRYAFRTSNIKKKVLSSCILIVHMEVYTSLFDHARVLVSI